MYIHMYNCYYIYIYIYTNMKRYALNTIKVSHNFCHILLYASLQNVYHVIEAVEAVVGTSCDWQCYGSWCTKMCLASLCVWFESCTDECAA